MLYARTGCSGWVRNAKVHRRWKDVGRAGPTVVKGAVRVGVRCGVGHGRRGGTRPVMVIVVDGVAASGVLLEEVVNFSRIARVAIPSKDHSAAHHDGEGEDESDYAEDHTDSTFVGEKAFLSRAGGRPSGNDGLGLGSCRVTETGSGAEVSEGRLGINIARIAGDVGYGIHVRSRSTLRGGCRGVRGRRGGGRGRGRGRSRIGGRGRCYVRCVRRGR